MVALLPAGMLAVMLAVEPMAEPARADGASFVVDHTGDAGDSNPGDGVCRAIGTGPTVCTLRAALEEADRHPGHDTIRFAIPGDQVHRIEPTRALPIIDDPAGLTIDGYSQPGASTNTLDHGSNARILIELRGAGPSDFDGLYINQSSGNVIRGLALFDFKRHIRLWGERATDNVVVGNFIGTDASGTWGQSEWRVDSTGVQLEDGAARNRIGAPGNADRNVISGNGDRGVAMFDFDDDGTNGNVVQNNVIGLRPDGREPLPNRSHGVDINWGASDNLVGGAGPGEGNVISGNVKSGVEISHNVTDLARMAGTDRNRVVGNLIGTDLTAASSPVAFRNHQFGVYLEGRPNCGATSCPRDITENEVVGNVIVGGPATVIVSKGANRSLVADNLIGVLPDGEVQHNSARWAVLISAGAVDNVVRGNTVGGARNGIEIVPNDLFGRCFGSGERERCAIDAAIPTFGNTITRNSVSGISPGLGIDLAPAGSITEAPPDIVQHGVRIPQVLSATEAGIVVATCGGCTVELFEATPSAATHGPGDRYVSAAVADGGGRAVLAPGSSLSVSDLLTVTATDPRGSTSEFSRRVVLAPRPGPPITAGVGAGAPTTAGDGRLQTAQRCSIGQC